MLRKQGLFVRVTDLIGHGGLIGHHVHLCHMGNDLGVIHDRFLAILCISISNPAIDSHQLSLLLQLFAILFKRIHYALLAPEASFGSVFGVFASLRPFLIRQNQHLSRLNVAAISVTKATPTLTICSIILVSHSTTKIDLIEANLGSLLAILMHGTRLFVSLLGRVVRDVIEGRSCPATLSLLLGPAHHGCLAHLEIVVRAYCAIYVVPGIITIR